MATNEEELREALEQAEFLMGTVTDAGVDYSVGLSVTYFADSGKEWLCSCSRSGVYEEESEHAHGKTIIEAVRNFNKKYSRSL